MSSAGLEGADGLKPSEWKLALPQQWTFIVSCDNGNDTHVVADTVTLHDDGLVSFETNGEIVAAFAAGRWKAFMRCKMAEFKA